MTNVYESTSSYNWCDSPWRLIDNKTGWRSRIRGVLLSYIYWGCNLEIWNLNLSASTKAKRGVKGQEGPSQRLKAVFFGRTKAKMLLLRNQALALAAFVAFLCTSVSAFSTPASSLSRSITANNVAFAPSFNSKSRSTSVSMSEAATADGDEKLFESFGKGIKRDYKARLPLYKSDIKDGLNNQVR